MKKLKTLFIALLICVTTCFSFLFTSCSGTETYKFKSILYDTGSDSVEIEVGEKLNGQEYKEDTFVLILSDDNTFMLRFDHGVEGSHDSIMITPGTWANGYNGEIYLTPYEGNFIMRDTTVAKKDGNLIIIDLSEGMIVTLEK